MQDTNKVTFYEDGFVKVHSIGTKDDKIMTIGDFFNSLGRGDYVHYDEKTKEFIIFLANNIKYYVCFNDTLKEKNKHSETNIVDILHDKYLEDKAKLVVRNLFGTDIIPESIEKLKLHLIDKEEQFKKTKAVCVHNGTISTISLLVTVACLIGTACFIKKDISDEFSKFCAVYLSVCFFIGGAIVSYRNIHEFFADSFPRYNLGKQYLNQVKECLKTIHGRTNKKIFKDNILKAINEINLSLKNVRPEKREKYDKLIRELLSEYKNDVNELLNNKQDTNIHLNHDYQYIIGKYTKKMGELQFMIDSDSINYVDSYRFNKECQVLEESINQGRLLGGH